MFKPQRLQQEIQEENTLTLIQNIFVFEHNVGKQHEEPTLNVLPPFVNLTEACEEY